MFLCDTNAHQTTTKTHIKGRCDRKNKTGANSNNDIEHKKREKKVFK